MSGTACAVPRSNGTVELVTGRDPEDSFDEYHTDPLYYYTTNTIAEQYGVTPTFLLSATEHVYQIGWEYVFGSTTVWEMKHADSI